MTVRIGYAVWRSDRDEMKKSAPKQRNIGENSSRKSDRKVIWESGDEMR